MVSQQSDLYRFCMFEDSDDIMASNVLPEKNIVYCAGIH